MNLFTTYYAASPIRQQELAKSLTSNLQNKHFDSIYVFLDPNTPESILDQFRNQQGFEKLSCLRSAAKPSFREWLEHSRATASRGISIFANADICFDDSVANLTNYLMQPQAVVCLTRHEQVQGARELHEKPHWSQDVWAIQSEGIADIQFLDQLSFETGQPRCDNRFAFVFAVHGWRIFNPCFDILAIHNHQSNIRNYRLKSPINVGGTAMVSPCVSPDSPSKVDIEIFCLDSSNIVGCRLNNWLEQNTYLSTQGPSTSSPESGLLGRIRDVIWRKK